MTKQIGIFGGSFNPPHLGHLIVCESIRSQMNLDRILFIPSATPPHKKDLRLAPADLRMEMTKLAVQGNPAFEASDIEIRRGGTSYTVDTLQEIHKYHFDARFSLIIGADNWMEFESWREPDLILHLADIIVMTRPGFTLDRLSYKYGNKVRFLDVPHIGISGTMIRLNIKSGRSIRYMVTPAVEEYIAEHGLYREKAPR